MISFLRRFGIFASDSILGRLWLLLLALFGVGAPAALSAAWLFAVSAATEAYDPLLISGAMQIAESIGVENDRVIVVPPDSAFETLALSKDDRIFYAVADPSGTLLTGHGELLDLGPTERTSRPRVSNANFEGSPVRLVAIDHLIAAPGVQGWSRVIVAETREARNAMAFRLMLKIGAIVLLASALGFFASLEAARRALLPLDRIGAALAARAPHDLAPLSIDSPRETRHLIAAINLAMSKLSERLGKLQTFTAIAAHQIRTPLSAVGVQAEMLEHDRTATARRSRVERIQSHVTRLSRLTNQLLGQAMVSYRTETAPRLAVDLVGLVRSVANETIPHALDRDLTVDLPPASQRIEVLGDNVSIREALANLIDNAVKHGARTVLRISVFEANYAVVAVADDGPGFPQDLWSAAQRPFQVPRTERSGAGMGISIVSETIHAHNGALVFGFTPDGLFEVQLRFPLLNDSDRLI